MLCVYSHHGGGNASIRLLGVFPVCCSRPVIASEEILNPRIPPIPAAPSSAEDRDMVIVQAVIRNISVPTDEGHPPFDRNRLIPRIHRPQIFAFPSSGHPQQPPTILNRSPQPTVVLVPSRFPLSFPSPF
ncbi:hypothetical protein MUK42_19019 [Musa troglodytarum]|uniref:Uncharacterized protein n=1 Tax=Musa troglodytarum TaxID=320322 RepID=A0A9E7GDH5_9LILI|nr:hypothetical protein MUK42_19019 [Musa troglodytarum]